MICSEARDGVDQYHIILIDDSLAPSFAADVLRRDYTIIQQINNYFTRQLVHKCKHASITIRTLFQGTWNCLVGLKKMILYQAIMSTLLFTAYLAGSWHGCV